MAPRIQTEASLRRRFALGAAAAAASAVASSIDPAVSVETSWNTDAGAAWSPVVIWPIDGACGRPASIAECARGSSPAVHCCQRWWWSRRWRICGRGASRRHERRCAARSSSARGHGRHGTRSACWALRSRWSTSATGEAGVLVGGLSGASPIPKQARDARGGGGGPRLGSPSEEVGHERGGDRPACGTWPDQGELAAAGGRLLDGSCVLR